MKTKTVFVEYSSADKGQHFMTVLFVEGGKRKIIGRIYKEYNPEIKKNTYRAQDWSGTPVFVDTKGLSELKNKFIEHGKTLADQVPQFSRRLMATKKQKFIDRTGREKQLRDVRKKPEIQKTKTEEKEEEPKVQYKEWDDLLTDESGDGRPFPEPENEQDNPISEETEREDELEQLRDEDYEYDRGEDFDIDR